MHCAHCGVERSKLTYHDSVTAALRMAVKFELCTVHNEIQSHSLYGLDVVTQLSGNGPVLWVFPICPLHLVCGWQQTLI